jgi:uncharacterized protein (DUF305 family)
MRCTTMLAALLAILLIGTGTARARISAQHSPEFQQMQAAMNELAQKSGADFEVAYINMLVAHHQGALEMAQMVVNDAPHQEVRDAAAQILQEQQREIDDLTRWLNNWYGQQVQPDPSMMMSQAMMDQMLQADPMMREKVFLAMMREHHQAAIEMGRLALERATHAELKDQAQQMITSQQHEQVQFAAWLQSWYGITAPAPTGDMQHGMEAAMVMMLPDTGVDETVGSASWGISWAAITGVLVLLGGGYALRRKLA